MNEETTAATEVTETIPTTAETTVPVTTEPETAPTETVETVGEILESVPEETPGYTEATEATETTAVVEVVDYTPIIENSTGILVNVILCAALIVVGFLAAIKFWGAK